MEVKTFIERGVSVMVGTRDSELVPELVRAWAPRVNRDRKSVSVCVAMAASARILDNLRDNGRVAVTFAFPGTSQAIQIWGCCLGTGQASPEDMAAVREHLDAFAQINQGLGVPIPFIEALWQRELGGSPAMIKIRFVAEQVFNQTPGPGAGSPL